MVDLVLTGPYRSISVYGRFAIKIDIPPGAAAGSSKGDAGGSINWEWDCYDPNYAEEVDKGPVTRNISSSDPSRKVEVTYAVMSNALEVTVQMKLRLKDGNNSPYCSIHGNITARIGDSEKEMILFRRTQETAQHFSPNTDLQVLQPTRSLELARNVVAVPRHQVLHIVLDLQIEASNNQGVSSRRHFNITLRFDNGTPSQHDQVDGDEVEVNVTWYPHCISAFTELGRPIMKVNIENIAV
jgi:hypothetical protein